jgi:hypothetical protein
MSGARPARPPKSDRGRLDASGFRDLPENLPDQFVVPSVENPGRAPRPRRSTAGGWSGTAVRAMRADSTHVLS